MKCTAKKQNKNCLQWIWRGVQNLLSLQWNIDKVWLIDWMFYILRDKKCAEKKWRLTSTGRRVSNFDVGETKYLEWYLIYHQVKTPTFREVSKGTWPIRNSSQFTLHYLHNIKNKKDRMDMIGIHLIIGLLNQGLVWYLSNTCVHWSAKHWNLALLIILFSVQVIPTDAVLQIYRLDINHTEEGACKGHRRYLSSLDKSIKRKSD